MVDRDKFIKARQRVQELTGFWIHFGVFVLVMTLLLVVNATADSDTAWWVQWPLLGWGIGIAAHAWAVFAHMPDRIARWQHRKMRQFMKGM